MKKIKSKDVLLLIEQAFLNVKLDTHVEMYQKIGCSHVESVNHLRERIGRDLLANVKPLIKNLLGEEE